MVDLSQDQVAKRAAIQKTALIWGVVVGAIVGLVLLWILGGQGGAVRFGGALVIGMATAFAVFRASFNSAAKTAKCDSCGAAFSRSRSDHVETLIASTPKDERKEQPDKSTQVTSWIEDKFDVLDTYTCAKCSNVTTKAYQTTRRRDEETVTFPYESAKGGQSQKGASAGDGKSDEGKTDSTSGRKGSGR